MKAVPGKTSLTGWRNTAYMMIDEHMRNVIKGSLRQSYQDERDSNEMKRLALSALIADGQARGALSTPLTVEEMVTAVVAVDRVINQTPLHSLLAVKRLEFIAENYFMYQNLKAKGKVTIPSPGTERYGEFLGRDKSRPWIARITGYDLAYGFAREFVNGRKDYQGASNNGARGVSLYFYLRPGYYEVNERTSWTHVRRYFIRVDGLHIIEITKEELENYLLRR